MRRFVSISAMAVSLAAGSAHAQTAKEQTGNRGISDIVVTAQRRAESVQKAALSIEVFSGDKLAERGIVQPDQLTKLAPGIQVGAVRPHRSMSAASGISAWLQRLTLPLSPA